MLLPKRVKYRRVHRGRLTGKAYRGNKVTYGDFGLQALEPAWITSNQIEAARVAMTRYCKRFGKVWIKIYRNACSNGSKFSRTSRSHRSRLKPEWVPVKVPRSTG